MHCNWVKNKPLKDTKAELKDWKEIFKEEKKILFTTNFMAWN